MGLSKPALIDLTSTSSMCSDGSQKTVASEPKAPPIAPSTPPNTWRRYVLRTPPTPTKVRRAAAPLAPTPTPSPDWVAYGAPASEYDGISELDDYSLDTSDAGSVLMAEPSSSSDVDSEWTHSLVVSIYSPMLTTQLALLNTKRPASAPARMPLSGPDTGSTTPEESPPLTPGGIEVSEPTIAVAQLEAEADLFTSQEKACDACDATSPRMYHFLPCGVGSLLAFRSPARTRPVHSASHLPWPPSQCPKARPSAQRAWTTSPRSSSTARRCMSRPRASRGDCMRARALTTSPCPVRRSSCALTTLRGWVAEVARLQLTPRTSSRTL